MNTAMLEMDFTLVHKGLRVQYVPEHGQLMECVALGHTIAQALADIKEGKQVESVL